MTFKSLFYYADIVQRYYNSAVPFTMRTAKRDFVHTSSLAHIKELGEVPESRLSMFALAEDMLQPKYTMNGFEVLEVNVAGTSLQYRVLRTLLTSNLPTLHCGLEQRISQAFHAAVQSSEQDCDGWSKVPILKMSKDLTRKATSYAFFGEHLSLDPVFLDAALAYPEGIFKAAEALRYVPEFLTSTIVSWITQDSRASKTLVEYLTPEIEYRMNERQSCNPRVPKPNDCLQYIIDTSPRKDPWPTSKIIQVTLGMWWASIHQLSMALSYALFDICDHPEYVVPLREELGLRTMEASPSDLPLMDSFLKESSRLHPVDTVSMRRKALIPYTFQDGLHIPEGSWVCVASRAMLLDPKYYQDPMSFDGYRFLGKQGQQDTPDIPPSRYTHTSLDFPFWGYGRRACPGRYYASHVLKLALRNILRHYDIKPADAAAKRTFAWRTAIIPRENVHLLFRHRTEKKPF